MAQSGNTVALKSFQSFMVNDGLLSKAVEAIKAGEKEARSSGNVQSFEVFYKGFRQNIAIGRIYIVPPSVADKKGQDFPTALLYGCLVRTFGGEEMGDLISHKIGDTEWDEYSQASYASIKEELFGTEDGKFASLILYAPNWVNKREYQGFQFPKDDNQLSNLTRHVIFSSYFDPRLSSAFDALMTDVETSKFDVTDITPKLNHPALAENPLKEFPLLTKEGSKKKPRLGLTFKTADEVTKEVLEPQEMDVFDSLDQALRNSLLPSGTKGVEDASEGKAPTKGEVVPRLAAVECDKCEGDGCKFCNKGVKKGSATAVFETPITNVGPGTEAHDEANQRTEGYKAEKDTPKTVINSAPIGIALDETGVPRRAEEERKEKSATTKVAHGYIAFYGGRRVEIHADSLYGAKLKAIEMLKVPKSKQGLLAVELAEKDGEQVTTTITSADKQAKRVEGLTCTGDVERLAAQTKKGDLSASASAAFDEVRTSGSGKALDEHKARMREYAASMGQDNQAHHAVADHKKEIAAGKHGPTPLSISSSKHKIAYVSHVPGHTNSKGEAAPWVIKQHDTDKILESFKSEGAAKEGLKNMESHKGSAENDPQAVRDHIKKNVSQARQGQDALKDHHASFDAAKWGGLGKKQASSLWVGTAKKVAADFDNFTRGYIETALWSSNDESDPSGGQPLDQNYDIRDLSPSCLKAMSEDCAQFQAENAELLAAASEQDGQDDFRQGNDFWLTRCGHGAGYWDGDYPTTGDGLTEASKAWGNVDIYVGDDDMIYQFGAEDAGERDLGQDQKGGQVPPVISSKKASKKTSSQNDASYIASLIGGGFGGEDYDARSQHSRTAAQKREEEMARKYSSQRKKFADVPQDIDDIWSETMEDMGPAPEIRLPGESKDNEKSTTGEHEIEAPEMSADSRSDVPEQVKGDQEEPTVEVEEALENDTTKSEEDEPSTGEGGASADSEETSSEGESEEKSEGDSKSEWAKNRTKGKSEKKDEPKEEESKTAGRNARPRERERVKCDQCEMLSINGTATHETGCPNQNSRWDADRQDWVKQRRCGECGMDVDADDPCCSAEPDFDNGYDENDEHFGGLDAILADDTDAVMEQAEEAATAAPAIFYECGACGGVHPSLETSERLGLGWNGDCRDEVGHFEDSDVPYGDNTQFVTLEEQMAPDFDDAILASKTADYAEGDLETYFDEGKTADYAEGDLETYFDEGKTADYAEDDFASYFGEEKSAGRSTTPKYVIRIPGSTDAAWNVTGYGQQRGAGQPNQANLARYMEALLKSMEPGGHNEHLVGHFDPSEAAVYRNDGTYKNPLATWSKGEAKQGADVSGDFSEAHSEVDSPDTVDQDIKQPTESVGEAGKRKNADVAEETKEERAKRLEDQRQRDARELTRRKAADISGDISEAKSNTESPDGVDADIKQPTVSVPEAARKNAKVGFTFNGQHREASFSDLTQAGKFIAVASAKFGKLAGDWTINAADDDDAAEDQSADPKKPAKAEPADAEPAEAEDKPADDAAPDAEAEDKPTEQTDETKGKNKPAETPAADAKAPAAAPAAPAAAPAVPAAPAPAAVAAPAGAGGNGTSETSGNETSTETGGSSPGGASTGGVGSGMGGAGTGGAGTGGAATSTGTGGAGTGGTVSIAPTSTNSAGGDEGGEGGEGQGGGAKDKTPTIIIYNGGTGGASTVDTDSGSGPGGDGPGSDGTGGTGEGSGGGGGGGGGRGTPRNPEQAADAVSPGVDSDNRQQGDLAKPQGNQSKGKPLATKPESQDDQLKGNDEPSAEKPELRGDAPVKPQKPEPPHEDEADTKEAAAGMPAEVGEFPYVETLVGMGWSDEGDPGHFMLNDSRVEVLTYTDGYEVYVDGELYESGDNVDELQNTLELVAELGTDALNAHQAADPSGYAPMDAESAPESDKGGGGGGLAGLADMAEEVAPLLASEKEACAGYGDEEDEERPFDLGIGDLADIVVETEDAN